MTGTVEISPEVVSDAALALSDGASFAGRRNAAVWIQGTRAVLSFHLNRQECERRAEAGLGAITSPDILSVLLGLPVEQFVSYQALTSAERVALRTVPRGATSMYENGVIRRMIPPLEVALALVPVVSWRIGLERAARFAPFCARAMVLRTLPRDPSELLMEADFYGIGVIVAACDAEPDVLIEPALFRQKRSTVAGWRFLEEVYRQVSSSVDPLAGPAWPTRRVRAAAGLPTS
jgi:hypothetical protein